MGKKNKQNKGKGGFEIHEDVLKMANATMKKFKKKNKNNFDGKKEMKKAYYGTLIELLPETITLLTRYGQVNEVVEIKESLYGKLTDPYFIKMLRKDIEDKEEIENIELLPIVIRDIINYAKRQEEEDKADGMDTDHYDMNDLMELSQLILKKKIKKMKNAGIDEDVAFDALSIMPHKSALKEKQINYRMRILMAVLYEHAKTKEIDFGKLITMLIPEEYADTVILYCLLERKDKFAKFNENQQKFFISINEWIFSMMEEMDRNRIERILKIYVDQRKRDESQNRDGNRRYFIKSLPENEYKNVTAVVKHMIERHPEIEKYF